LPRASEIPLSKFKIHHFKFLVMKFTLFCFSLLLFSTACFEPRSPLAGGSGPNEIETALLELIQFHQRENIRESCGEMAHQCFTDRDFGEFVAAQKAQKSADALIESPRFVSIARAIARQPTKFWNDLRQKALATCRPTWAQLGKIDCAGQTNAGQRAELQIAAAIVNQLEIMLKNDTPATAHLQSVPPDSSFFNKLKTIRWICYAPTHFNPDAGLMPADSSIEADLALLKKTGFSGLVTYGCDGSLGKTLPMLAQKHGFEGLILGIWSPKNPEELQNARDAAKLPIVTAFCVGNEGLGSLKKTDTQAAPRLQNGILTAREISDCAR